MAQQPDGGTSNGTLVTDVVDEIQVTLDQWSLGQLGVVDLVAATAVVVVGIAGGWVVSRLLRRAARNTTGAARTAVDTVGRLVGSAVVLLAVAVALEILGFSLGPMLIVVVVGAVAVFLLRPLITNLSSGLLLQVRGALDVGDLIRTTEDVLGVVQEVTTRTVVIDTADGHRVHIPNSEVLEHAIINYTVLGRRRSTFEITVQCGEDLEMVMAAMRLALAHVDAILADPPPEVQTIRLVGRLVAIRALVWHLPGLDAERAAVDAGIRASLAGLRTIGVEPDGPTLAQLYSDQ